jgi:hypothetical protein
VGRAAWTLAGLFLLVGLGLAAWQLAAAMSDGSDGATPASESTETQSTSGRGPLEVTGIEAFDPPPKGNGEENDDRVRRVLDGDTSTVWTTKTYQDPFGPSGLKDGVGLVLDLGEKRAIGSVAIALRGDGTDLELRVADERGEQPDDYTRVALASDETGLVEVRPDEPAEGRYVLIWLTAVPPADDGYRGTIAEVGVRG